MIYLENITTPQFVDIPRTGLGSGTTADFRLRSTVDHRDVLESSGLTLETNSRHYYTIGVTLPSGLLDGEYEYALEQSGVVISSGVVRVGEYERVQQGGSATLTFRQAK